MKTTYSGEDEEGEEVTKSLTMMLYPGKDKEIYISAPSLLKKIDEAISDGYCIMELQDEIKGHLSSFQNHVMEIREKEL